MSQGSQMIDCNPNFIEQQHEKYPMDFYLQRIVQDERQMVVIDVNGYFITYQTKDQAVNFTLFMEDANQELKDFKISDEEYKNKAVFANTIVFLKKDQLGCVVLWSSQKASSKLFRLVQ